MIYFLGFMVHDQQEMRLAPDRRFVDLFPPVSHPRRGRPEAGLGLISAALQMASIGTALPACIPGSRVLGAMNTQRITRS